MFFIVYKVFTNPKSYLFGSADDGKLLKTFEARKDAEKYAEEQDYAAYQIFEYKKTNQQSRCCD